MLIFIYGDDTFRVQEKVMTMKKAFAEKFDANGMNLDIFPEDGKTKLEIGNILQSACSFPFLGEKRMVIVKELIASTKSADVKDWEQGLVRAPESTIVILWETLEPKALEKKPLFKVLSEHSEVHFYPLPELIGNELILWAQKRVNNLGGSIDQSALQVLVGRVGSDLWQMSAEIEKLVSYASKSPIDSKMVEELVCASFEGQIFALVDAVSKKNIKDALKLLREERWSGANDFYLLSMLARQVRLLLGARSYLDMNPGAIKGELASELGVHPFVASKILVQAKGFTFENLKDTYNLLFRYDGMMKTGRIDADLAVDLVAVDLMK
jgi:DNA polymerase III subunit delta